ncbi:MAG: hypothetical protein M3Q45_06730, partial [Chloroflexota bacterium]|nr:hypothetical protein [Chloroflexota bacterium]
MPELLLHTPIARLDQPTSTVAAFYAAAVANQLPIALWRQPGERAPQAIVDLSGRPQPDEIDFHTDRPSFIFSPFVKEQHLATLRLQADLYLGTDGVHIDHGSAQSVQHVENYRRFLWTYQQLLAGELSLRPAWYAPSLQVGREPVATEAEFDHLVELAIDFMRATNIRKIVVSRRTETPLPAHFDPIITFQQLCNRYPHAFI